MYSSTSKPIFFLISHLGTTVLPTNKSTECYLGLLHVMDDVAVYGYITPLRVKIVVMLALTDSIVRDADIGMVCARKL